jgi:hypothetical protein
VLQAVRSSCAASWRDHMHTRGTPTHTHKQQT